jgi:hypothetical protein
MLGAGVWPSLAGSARLFARRPLFLLALGSAVVLSLIAVCCGIGVLSAPWFMCELFAVQLGLERGRPLERSEAWLGAGLILFGAVLLVGSVAWLAALGFGSELPVTATVPGATPELLGAGALAAALCTTVLALVFVLPYLYAPLILLERGGTFGAAVLDSARLVQLGGPLAQLGLSLAAHLLIALPVLACGLIAFALRDLETVPLGMLLGLPLTAISLPLGQGMFVHAFAGLRGRLTDARHVQAPGRPPPLLITGLALVTLAPALALAMLGASLVRPGEVRHGRLPAAGELLADRAVTSGETVRVEPPETALEVAATSRWARVAASDGGGAGRLPLPEGVTLTRLRVLRQRDAYAIELGTAHGAPYLTWIDRAGVRLDDGLRARLAERVPAWGLLFILASLSMTSLLQLPVLTRLADVRREHALVGRAESHGDGLSQQRLRALGFARRALLLATPAALGSLYLGIASWFG